MLTVAEGTYSADGEEASAVDILVVPVVVAAWSHWDEVSRDWSLSVGAVNAVCYPLPDVVCVVSVCASGRVRLFPLVIVGLRLGRRRWGLVRGLWVLLFLIGLVRVVLIVVLIVMVIICVVCCWDVLIGVRDWLMGGRMRLS